MTAQITERCEWNRQNGEVCINEAAFIVSIGTRKFDSQRSCSRHLAATVAAMVGAEAQHGLDKTVELDKSATVKWYPNGIARRASDG